MATSFIKWPGGKRWLTGRYNNLFNIQYNRYFEPFLGGGSVFFHLEPERAFLSDINADLINVYQVMRDSHIELRNSIETHRDNHNQEYYYHIRGIQYVDPIEKAASFLYLNRTCFNGMYRVNRNGQFNVPIGTKPCFVESIDQFSKYARMLENTTIRQSDFVRTIGYAREGDLIFVDPPYTISHNQNSFIKYNENLFSWDDQLRLIRALERARERGVHIIATNANYPPLRALYEQARFYTSSVLRHSSISGNSKGRGHQEELIVTSFPIEI